MALTMFLSGISILPFKADAALEYGDICHNLKSQGNPIGANDMLIATHARALVFTDCGAKARRLDYLIDIILFFTAQKMSGVHPLTPDTNYNFPFVFIENTYIRH